MIYKGLLTAICSQADCGRYLKVGLKLGWRRRPWSGVGRWVWEGVAFSHNGSSGYNPGKFWKFCVQNGAFGGKITLCFDSKQTAIL